MTATFDRFQADQSGSGAVEFAFLAPLIIAMALLTCDLGMGAYQQMQVQSAAGAGAQYAVVSGFDKSGIAASVRAATPNSGISASPDPVQFCACPGSTGLTATTCGSTCSSGKAAGNYVTVSASAVYNTIAPYPGVSNSFALTAQATVRMQ